MATVCFWVLIFLSSHLLTFLHKDGRDQSNQTVGFSNAEPSVRARWWHQNHLIKVSPKMSVSASQPWRFSIRRSAQECPGTSRCLKFPRGFWCATSLGKIDLGQSLLKTWVSCLLLSVTAFKKMNHHFTFFSFLTELKPRADVRTSYFLYLRLSSDVLFTSPNHCIFF